MPVGSLLASQDDPLGRPKSTQDRPKSLLETSFSPKSRCSIKKTSATEGESTILTPRRHPRRPKIDPRSTQDGSKTIFKSIFFRLRFCLRFWSVLGPIFASSWPPLDPPNDVHHPASGTSKSFKNNPKRPMATQGRPRSIQDGFQTFIFQKSRCLKSHGKTKREYHCF